MPEHGPLIRDVLATIAFLYSHRLPDDVHERLAAADDVLVKAVDDLIKLRVPEAPDA